MTKVFLEFNQSLNTVIAHMMFPLALPSCLSPSGLLIFLLSSSLCQDRQGCNTKLKGSRWQAANQCVTTWFPFSKFYYASAPVKTRSWRDYVFRLSIFPILVNALKEFLKIWKKKTSIWSRGRTD